MKERTKAFCIPATNSTKREKPVLCRLMKEHTIYGISLEIDPAWMQLPICRKCEGQRNMLNCTMRTPSANAG